MGILKEVERLRKSVIQEKIDERLKEFEDIGKDTAERWFSELCFCLLTANSKAKTAIAIQQELGIRGFCECASDDVKRCIMKHKHRFHNNKTKYILEARRYKSIKGQLQRTVMEKSQKGARRWLAENIKGLGYKEASHFMRNVGYKDLAILDRHILNLFVEEGIIHEKPKALSAKKYLELEKAFEKLAKKAKMSCAELDMYMWYVKTGEILK